MKNIRSFVFVGMASMMLWGCGGDSTSPDTSTTETTPAAELEAEEVDPMNDKGVGVITNVELGEIDQELAVTGKELYEAKCTACHKMEKRFIGPSLKGVTERRTPEWIMNMILDPERMVKENKLARELLMEYISPMANQSLTQQEARSILEYFRTEN